MLPWHQRRSRRMNSINVGGFSSQPRFSSGRTRTSYPAARIRAASIWSWLRIWRSCVPISDEFNQCRRVLLPTQILFRQDPDFVSGGAHQGRLDLVVAEDMAILRSDIG